MHAFTSTKRFVIERELGHGGMGVVYQALDLERNTQVALKALTQRDAVNIYRLKNEFRQLADLSHPNLVMLHELCNEGSSWFFTMELVKGKSFDVYVAEERLSMAPHDRAGAETAPGRFLEASITLSQRAIGSEFPLPRVTCNLKRLRHALRQLVEAVAALHDAGKLHRDIKPSNVLVTAEGRVVVLDFGLVSNSTVLEADAQDADRTVGGCMFGTPAYMSPEQAAGDTVSMASDWYAVGTMLYEALTGQLPFDGSVLDILRQKETTEPVPPSELVRGVPDDLDQLCRDLLRRDPSKRLSGTEILRYLTGHSAPPPVFDAESSNIVRKYGELFVGRESHLRELRAAFEQSRAGRPTAVLVHGYSGIGKSALVRCFANELIRNDEAVVLRGRCYERETVPYKAFDNIIDALSRYMMRLPSEEAAELLPRNVHSLALLFPVLRRVKAIAQARRPKHATIDARELRNQAFAALKDLLLRITDFHPLVINIDDLQWADMDSARLLSFLMGPPDPPPLLLVGTYRRDEATNSPFLRHIISDQGLGHGGAEVRELPLDALSEEEAQQLSSALLRDLEDINALASSTIAAEAEGVPFFIAELAQHVKTHRERADLAISAEPVTLDQVILERVSGMPEPAQRLLQVLSVAAGPLEQGVAIEAAGLTRGDRTATLALRAARLIRTRGTRQSDSAETYHDRVRETVVRHLEPQRVREVHAAIAAALEHHEVVDPERLVVHYTGAGDGGRAGETATQAAHAAAAKLAFNRAAELFKKAIELRETADDTKRDLYKHMGDALANAGRGAQAAEAYLKAAEGLASSAAATLRRLAVRQFMRSGLIGEGTALAQRLFEEVGLSFPGSMTQTLTTYAYNRALLAVHGYDYDHDDQRPAPPLARERLATLASTYQEFGVVDLVRGAALQAQFLRYARKARDPEQLMHGLAWEAWNVAITSANSERALRVLSQVERLAARLGTPYAAATALSARAGCSLFFGRVGEVVAPAAEAEQIFKDQCPGTAWEQNLVATYRYTGVEHVGGFTQLTQEVPPRTREAIEKSDRFGTAFSTLYETFCNLVLDRPETAEELLEIERHRLVEPYNAFHFWVVVRNIHLLLYLDEGERALHFAELEMPRFNSSACARGRFYVSTMQYLAARCCLAAAKRSANRELLLKRAQRHAKWLLKANQPQASGLAHLVLAETAWRRGNLDDAEHVLKRCAEGTSWHQSPLFAAYAQRSLGLLVGGDAGREIIEATDHQLTSDSVRNPASWTRIWIDLTKP